MIQKHGKHQIQHGCQNGNSKINNGLHDIVVDDLMVVEPRRSDTRKNARCRNEIVRRVEKN